MSEFKENLKQVEHLLKTAQIHEEYAGDLYRFLSIDKTATKEAIQASIGEKHRFYLSKQNLNGWETLTKVFISAQPAIEYILFECKPEYDNYLLAVKIKALRKQFISRISPDHELDAKAKKKIVKQGLDIGLSEMQTGKIMAQWLEEYGVKPVEASPPSASSSNARLYNELLGKTYHEIFGLPSDADSSEATQIIKIIDRWMEKDGVKPPGLPAPSDSVSDYLPYNEFSGKTYYEIFGIPNDADYSEIKKRYDEKQEKYANAQDEARWLLISEAWEILKDKDKRDAYDKKINKREAELEDSAPTLKNGLDIFKIPFALIQGIACAIVMLAILSHFGVSSAINRKVEQERADTVTRTENPPVSAVAQPGQLQPLPETGKIAAVADRAGHNRFGALIKGTLALSGSLTGVDSKTVGIGDFWRFGFEAANDKAHYGFGCSNYDELHFRINGNDVDRVAGREAMSARPDRVTLYFHAQDWDFVQKCSKGSRCAGSICPLAIVAGADANAQSAWYRPPLAGAVKNSSVNAGPGKKNTRAVSSMDKKKKWKPRTSSFAPPSRDDL